MTIFRKDNLNQGVQLTNWFLGALSFVNFIIGLICVIRNDWREAYGNVTYESGAGLIFICLLQAPFSCLGVYAGRNHNKLILLLHCCMMTFNAFVMLILGGLLLGVTKNPWDIDWARECLGTYPDDRDECMREYLMTDAFQGFKLVWLSFYQKAYNEGAISYKQQLIGFQREGSCCGFGPPLRCEENRDSWPAALPSDSTDTAWAYSGKRQKCGAAKGWYPATASCNRIVDPMVYPPVYGGCPYEYPIGECSGQFPDEASRGCAVSVEQTFKAGVADTATVILVCTLIPILAGVCSCCLFFKRKDWDVLPETYPGLIKRKAPPKEEIDEDGFLMLSVAQTPHEFIKAFNMCIRDAELSFRTKSERSWKLDDFLKICHEKQEKMDGKFPAEVDQAYKRAMKVIDDIDTKSEQDSLVGA